MAVNKEIMKTVFALSEENVRSNHGGPFAAIIVRNGKIVGQGVNSVTSLNDPTAHAEVMAIRDAAKKLSTYDLSDCELYTSCEPCPMCLSAVYWAHIPTVYYGNTKENAAKYGFDDDFIYKEIKLNKENRKLQMTQTMNKEALKAFDLWRENENKIDY